MKTQPEPRSSTTRSHEHELTIDAPPETVWRAITTAEDLVNWFPLEAAVTPGAGGSITYGWGPGMTGTLKIEAWEPPHHLRTSWFEPGSSGPATVVDWHLEGRGGRTVLRLVHSGFARDASFDEEFDGTRRGWDFELSTLKHWLERQRGKPRTGGWHMQPVKLDEAAAWRRVTHGFVREGWSDALTVGAAFRFTFASGDTLAGTVTVMDPPRIFAGRVPALGDALVRFGFEVCGGMPATFVALSAWGRAKGEAEALMERWKSAMAQAAS
jgi:uncharacterized protein YndB with AHSA1/START domain